jgi:hypothetical protein
MKNIKRINKKNKMDVTTQIRDILKECVENILIECGLPNNDAIDAIVANSINKIEESHKGQVSDDEGQVSDDEGQVSDDECQVSDDNYIYDMDIGKCCFCNDECNPMSQSCGSCMRGLSVTALGIHVPGNLQKFM